MASHFCMIDLPLLRSIYTLERASSIISTHVHIESKDLSMHISHHFYTVQHGTNIRLIESSSSCVTHIRVSVS